MPSYNIQDGNEGFKRFKTVGEGTDENPYVPVVGINVVPDVDSTTGWSDPLSDTNVVSEKLIKETIDNQEITSASFNTADGVLTLTKIDGNITVDLDGRYLSNVTVIDADVTPISNLEVDNFKGTAIVTEAEGISNNDNDTTIPTSAAVKDYVDNTVIPDTNTYVTSASFNTSDGVLTLTLNDSSTVTVDLDGRFLQNIFEDTTPQLGGNLDLNSNDITGTGNISITGEVEATTLIGNMRGATIFKAKAGEALTKGDPVYISGDDITGNQPVVSIADSDDANKMPCFGLAIETVSINASVNVVTFGTLSGLDTSSFAQGDILYISTTGTLTATKPTGESSLIQNIGKVMRSHASAGSIKVGGAGRTNDVPNLNDGNVFIGNASNQAETRGLTLDDIAETATNKHFTASDETKLDGIETGADVTDSTNVDAAGAVMNSDTSTASMGFVIDEDTMVSNSATKVPTQQSVKAYVDANAGGTNPANSFTQNSGQHIATEGIRAKDNGGISILDDSGTQGIALSDAGNVGIGTFTPSSKFDLVGGSGNTMALQTTKANTPNGSYVHSGTNADWYIRSGNSSGKVVLQDTGGNVGIGNSAPDAKVVIEGVNTEAGGLRFRAKEGQSTTDRLIMYATGGSTFNIKQSNDGVVQILDHDGNVDLAVNTYTRKVGIGTNQPTERLQVSGNVRAGTTSNVDVNIGQHSSYTGYGAVWVNGESHYRFLFQANSGTIINAIGDGDILFRNDNSQMARMNQNGDFIIDGNFECDDGINIRGNSPSIHFNDTDSNREFTIHVNSNRAYFLPHIDNQSDLFTGGWDQMGGGWTWFDLNDGFFYSPRFVDSNNTNRFIDASSQSQLEGVTVSNIKTRRVGFRSGEHTTLEYSQYAYGGPGGNYDTVHGRLNIYVAQGWDGDSNVMRFDNEGYGNKTAYIYGNLNVSGSISKGSGSFDIAHPDPKKTETHRLRHYFVETPSAGGNIYKYQIECKKGDNYIDLPDYFQHLNKDSLVWANPFKHFGRAWGEVIDGGKKAKIVVEQSGIYNILIFGDRKDAIAMQEFEKYGVEYEIKESK